MDAQAKDAVVTIGEYERTRIYHYRKIKFKGRKRMKYGLNFVLGVNLIIWFGIAFYLFILDRKIRKLENTSQDIQR